MVRNVMWWLLANSQGGISRARILEQLISSPHNANALSNELGLDYKTIRYHLKVLEENGMVVPVGGNYGKTYFPSDELESNKEYFFEIWDKIGKKADKRNK